MGLGAPVPTAGHFILMIHISKNLCINCALRRRHRICWLQVDGSYRMILQSTRMATSQIVLGGGIFQACISLACTAGAAPSLASLVQLAACSPLWPRGKRSMTKHSSSRRMVSALVLNPERCIEYHTSGEFHVWLRKASRGRGMMPEHFLSMPYTAKVCSN